MNGNTVASARVVMGAVAPVPWRSEDAERALVGKPLNETTAAAQLDGQRFEPTGSRELDLHGRVLLRRRALERGLSVRRHYRRKLTAERQSLSRAAKKPFS